VKIRLITTCVVAIVLLLGAARLDVHTIAGEHKGDEATFILMAFSLAKDGDLEYTKEDLDRAYGVLGRGPEGLFVKRSYDLDLNVHAQWPPVSLDRTPVPATESLSYAKSFLYGAVAAPFAAVAGLGGLLLLNVLLLGVTTACAIAFCRARCGPVGGALLGTASILATVIPVYVVWLTPELLNLTLVTVAYFLWLFKEVTPASSSSRWRGPWTDAAAALCLGLATFSKLSNGPLVAPLVCQAILRRRWRQAAGLTFMFALGSAGLFGVNGWVSGDFNYQGSYREGDRKSFYSHFPFENPTATLDSLGNEMATNTAQSELQADNLTSMLARNSVYFLFGRNAGLFAYFLPGAVIALMWLMRWRAWTSWQWLSFTGAAGSAVVLLVLLPDSWSGGGGPVGNRYYLSVYPVLLFLVPSGVGLGSALLALAGGLVFTAGMLIRPFAISQEPWTIAERWPLRVLPIELTMLDDLPVRLNRQRGRIPFWEEHFVLMYYMDGHTGQPEPAGGKAGAPIDGFWIAGDREAEIAIRSDDAPLTRVTLNLSTRVANTFTVSMGGRSTRVALPADGRATIILSPRGGFRYKTSYAYVLRMTTTAGFVPAEVDTGSTDTRNLGVYVRPVFRARALGDSRR